MEQKTKAPGYRLTAIHLYNPRVSAIQPQTCKRDQIIIRAELAYARLCGQLWNVLVGLLFLQLVGLKPIARLSAGVVLRSALAWRVLFLTPRCVPRA